MSKAVFFHKSDSIYDDRPDQYYHFPKSYLGRVQETVGDFIVYYGPLQGSKSRFYTAVARVSGLRPDPARADHYYADVEGYLQFVPPVDYRADGGYERKLVQADGSINGGTVRAAVRLITPAEFQRIVGVGIATQELWPERVDSVSGDATIDATSPGFEEEGQTFIERPIVQRILNKKFRDIRFRHNILQSYDRTCAFTGLRLINGGGRPEVEAAHIIPVEENGTDSVRNGIALSATIHWMFDRGLLTLEEDFSIRQSRHLNYDISHILNRDMKAKVPIAPHLQPHPAYLEWHRTYRYKQ
jgi:putative restriction endonuclease